MKNLYILSPDFASGQKKKVIWGTGDAGIKVFFLLVHEGVRVDAFCDSYDSKLNKCIFGKNVISVDALKGLKDEYTVIIASMYWEDIYADLEKSGFNDIYVAFTHDYMPKRYSVEHFIEPKSN